jgi:hypothetical protein
MSQTTIIRAAAGLSVIAAISAISMLASAGTASAKSVLSCEGTNRGAVVECCQEEIRRSGMPFWMQHSGGNCNKAAKCTGTFSTANNRHCWIATLQNDQTHGKDRRKR